MAKLLMIPFVVFIFSVGLTGCKTTTRTSQAMNWAPVDPSKWPVEFHPNRLTGARKDALADITPFVERSSRAEINIYRLTLHHIDRRLTYWYSKLHSGYAWSSPPDLDIWAKKLGNGVSRILSKGRVRFRNSYAPYVIIETPTSNCARFRANFGVAGGDLTHQVYGTQIVEWQYCSPRKEEITEAVIHEINGAFSISQ